MPGSGFRSRSEWTPRRTPPARLARPDPTAARSSRVAEPLGDAAPGHQPDRRPRPVEEAGREGRAMAAGTHHPHLPIRRNLALPPPEVADEDPHASRDDPAVPLLGLADVEH